MKKEDPCEMFRFQLQLLLKMEEMKKYPFAKMVIEKELTKSDYIETLELLEKLDAPYKDDCQSGFIHHQSFPLHYAGMLCHKLPIDESLEALECEDIYPDVEEKLMELSKH
ncbi:DUF1878 family protein [Halobacillus sp. BBL2006]|uniref:DUF1878 family protein n=1 Tax=Halobacillus sp. BBL2006 TaxID=1543706 RepID=UPI0005425080|nr:DUF1878 family protein [Halobacillus sp. BBL2006]KHE67715.1 hypothetical protein LD39_16315 [Halobacillus sp. BBL2006]